MAEKHAGGRPTKYSDAMLTNARKYIRDFKPSDECPIPMIVSLCRYLNVAKSTLYVWAEHKDRQEFSDVLAEIMEYQEQLLFAGGLTGIFNPAITKLGLTKHGYADKQELAGNDGKDLLPPVIQIVHE